ncbi:tyrosine-type recombinase/integrase [Streptococcus hyointestinalis]
MGRTRYTGVTKDETTGKYMYYFKAGVDLATGKPYQERRRGFDTAKEAFEARTEAMSKVQRQGGVKHTQMTFQLFVEKLFKPHYYATRQANIEDKEAPIFKELVERFGKKKPRDITVIDVTLYKNDILKRHSKSYAKKKMGLLNQILKSARNHGLIFVDIPTERVDPISVERVKVDFWTKAEFEQVISSLNLESYFEHFIFTLLWLYYFTGMRVNEATALYWEDLDFDKGQLSINHNLQYINRENWVRSDKLKTDSSRRIIGLDKNTLSVLKSWKERQETLLKAQFILSPDGNPYPKRSIRDQIIKYAKRAGVKPIQPKGLRHSHASLLINEYNTNALYVQKRLGHADVKTTLSVYSHLYPNADTEITSRLGTLFDEFVPKHNQELPK